MGRTRQQALSIGPSLEGLTQTFTGYCAQWPATSFLTDMMIDLILLGAIGASFYGGFKLGNRFKSLGEALAHFKAQIK